MYKQLILSVGLIMGNSLRGMAQTKEISSAKEVFHREVLVKILLTDPQNSETIHEVAVPIRYAQLLGALSPLLENAELQKEIFPLSQVTPAQWGLIEPYLERLYGIICDDYKGDRYREDIAAEFKELDAKNLIALIHALDYCDIPVLLEIAGDLLNHSAVGTCTFEQINSLPREMGKSIMLHTILSIGGPLSAQQLLVCRAEKDLVSQVVANNNGTIGSCSEDAIRVWDLNGTERAVGKGRTIKSEVVCQMNNGNLVMGSNDSYVRVFSMQGKILVICRGHESAATSVCVTNDKKIVSGSEDGQIRVWDMKGNQLALCTGHEGKVTSVCVTDDGKIVSGSWDSTVRLWDISLWARINCTDEDQAKALWELLGAISQQAYIDKPQLWREIEKILLDSASGVCTTGDSINE